MSSLKDRVIARTAEAVTTEKNGKVVDRAANDETLSWLDEHETYFAENLPRHIDVRQFIQVANSAMNGSPQLLKCDKTSMAVALAKCAHFGLDPDGVHAAIVPMKNVATFIPMYQGLIDLMYQSGMVARVEFDAVRKGDEWSLDKAKPFPDDLTHKPDIEGDGEVRFQYAFALLERHGGRLERSKVVALNRRQAEEIMRKHSRAWQRAEKKRADNRADFERNPWKDEYNSPWHTDFDAMWLKSCVIRLARAVPKSPRLRELLRYDATVDDPVYHQQTPQVVSLPSAKRDQIGQRRQLPAGEKAVAPSEPDDDTKARWLIDEITLMTKIRGAEIKAVRTAAEEALGYKLERAPLGALHAYVGGFRAAAVQALCDQGEDELADAYQRAAEADLIAPTHELLGLPEPHDFQQGEESDMCTVEGCGRFQDEVYVHGGP